MSFGLDAFITKAQEGNRSCWESPSKKLYFEAKKDPQGFLAKYAK
jgi:hypothetical protein